MHLQTTACHLVALLRLRARRMAVAPLNRRNSTITALLVSFACVCGPAAFAGLVVTFEQSGSDVTATLSGSINATPLGTTPFNQPIQNGLRTDDGGLLYIGSGTNSNTPKLEFQYAELNFPSMGGISTTSFNTATVSTANVPDQAFLIAQTRFYLSPSYNMGDEFAGVLTWQNKTLTDLELVPGTYSATLDGSSSTVTVDVASAVPEPSTWALGAFALACGGWQLTLRRRALREKA